jgi:phage terminase small subunit
MSSNELELSNHEQLEASTFPGLNQRQTAFVWNIIEGMSGKDAYIAAGYSARGKSAEAAGSTLLRNHKVQWALARVREELAERTKVTKEYVMQGLKENYERCMQAVEVYDKEGNPTGVWQWQPQAANKSLELMGKELGMFGDKVEVSGGLEPIKTLTIVKHVRDDGPQVNGH